MARNQFIDPAGDRDTYDWQVNHSEEGDFGKTRNITYGGNTGDVGFVRQQADDSPLKLSFSGTILHEAQVIEMLAWFQLCKTQTIFFKDYAGDEYEVLITRFVPKRQRTIKNPRDFTNAPYWYWKYDIDMDVIKIRDGVWEGVTP